jgi:heat shock protein HslJ
MLRRTELHSDRPPQTRLEIGRWQADGTRLTLTTENARSMAATWEGNGIRMTGGHLSRQAAIVEFDDTLRLRGFLRNGTFEECSSGRSWRLADGSIRALASLPGGTKSERAMLIVLGHFQNDVLVVDAPIRFSPGETCAAPEQQGASPMPVLEGAWTLTELDGKALPSTLTPAPDLTFTNGKAGGFAGCNRYGGSYRSTPGSLRFSELISTQMACQQTPMELEGRFLEALQRTTAYRLNGQILELQMGSQPIARFRKRQ